MPNFNDNRMFVDKKSRIVAKEYLQIQEIDFEETYTTTACLKLFQLLLAIVALLGLYLWQLDFVIAYLNSNIDFNIYIKQLLDFVESRDNIV